MPDAFVVPLGRPAVSTSTLQTGQERGQTPVRCRVTEGTNHDLQSGATAARQLGHCTRPLRICRAAVRQRQVRRSPTSRSFWADIGWSVTTWSIISAGVGMATMIGSVPRRGDGGRHHRPAPAPLPHRHIRGNRYRMREHRALATRLVTPTPPPTAPPFAEGRRARQEAWRPLGSAPDQVRRRSR